MNEVHLKGIISRKPNSGTSAKGVAWCFGGMSTGTAKKKQYHNLAAFKGNAEFLRNLIVGDELEIVGTLEYRKREDKDYYEAQVVIQSVLSEQPEVPQGEISDDDLPF